MYMPKATAFNQDYYKNLGKKNTIKDLKQVCPKQDHDLFFNVLIVHDDFIQIENISVTRHLVLNAQIS